MVVIAHWMLQRNTVEWKSSDDFVHLRRCDTGWLVNVYDDERLQLLQHAGLSDVVVPVSFTDIKRLVTDILDCSSTFVQSHPSYRVLDSPYTLIRNTNGQWIFKYQSLSTIHMISESPMWKYINQRIRVKPSEQPREFNTRESALVHLNRLIERFHQDG